MSSSRGNSSAAPTSARTARARSLRRRPRSHPGASALTSCASSIAANPSRKQQLPAPMLRVTRPNHRTRLPSRGSTINWASALLPRPNFLLSSFSPPLAPHGSAREIPREVERASGQQASERWQDGSTAIPVRTHHHRVQPTPHRSSICSKLLLPSKACLPVSIS